MSGTNHEKTRRLVGMALFTAIVVVLQLLGSFIKVGTFAINLTLIPIIVGAALYGKKAGAWLGFVFSVVVVIMCITGADAGGFILWSANWFSTLLICILKGTAAGFLAGVIYKLLEKKNRYVGVGLAAVVCPVVNTGIFILGLSTMFKDVLVSWAGGTDVVYYVITGLVGVNFLLELLINVVLSPVIVRLIKIGKKGV